MLKKCWCCGHIINDNEYICSSCRSKLSQEQYLLLLSLFDKQNTQDEENKRYRQLHYYQTMQYNHVVQHLSTHMNDAKDTALAENEILQKLAINDTAPVIFEVLRSQIKSSGNNFKVYMPNGFLHVYASAILTCAGHIFITLPKNKQYRLIDTNCLKSEKTYSISEIMLQNINYGIKNKELERAKAKLAEKEKDKTIQSNTSSQSLEQNVQRNRRGKTR